MMDPEPASLPTEPQPTRPRPAPWVWALAAILFAGALYGLGLERMPLEGEETRRGRFATEMIASRDWVVTTQQHEPYVDRPPLQYWAISAVYLVTGDDSVWSLRLSGAIATILTVVLILWYAAPLAGWPFAAFAAVAFATMGLVLDLGWRAETESVFMLLLAGALLIWHGALVRGWPAWAAWTIGYSLAALATLTKGTQAPVTFVGTVVLWLALQRRWSNLLSPGHAIGVLAYAVIVGAWLVPLYQRLGWDSLRESFVEPGRERFDAPTWQYFKHWSLYPVEVLIGMLPWSPLLVGARSFLRRAPGDPVRSSAGYLLLAMAVMLAPLWLAPWARGRYFLPAYPLAAVLLGLVVAHAGAGAWPAGAFQLMRAFLRFLAIASLVGAAVLLLAPLAPERLLPDAPLPIPWRVRAAVAAAAALAGALLLRAAAARSDPLTDRRRLVAALCGAGVLVALLHRAIVVPVLAAPAVDTANAISEAKARVPAGHDMVSIGTIHHRFAYYWHEPIRLVPSEPLESLPERIAPGAFFCVNHTRDEPPSLPFPWDEVASIGMDVYREDAEQRVVIGRRRADETEADAPP